MTYLTPQEVADRLNVNKETVYRLIREKKLIAANVGSGNNKYYRIDEKSLEEFLSKGGEENNDR